MGKLVRTISENGGIIAIAIASAKSKRNRDFNFHRRSIKWL